MQPSRQQSAVVMSALIMLAQVYQTGGQTLDQLQAAGASDPHALLRQYRECLAAATAGPSASQQQTESDEAYQATIPAASSVPEFLQPASLVHGFMMMLQPPDGPLSQADSPMRTPLTHTVLPAIIQGSVTQSPGTYKQVSPQVEQFILAHVVQPLLSTFASSQRAAKPLTLFYETAQKMQVKPSLLQHWCTALGALDWGPCASVEPIFRDRAVRFVLQNLWDLAVNRLVKDELQSPNRSPIAVPDIDNVEQEKLYWISGYLIQLLQLTEIKSKANPDNANWQYIIALNALRVPRDRKDLMPDAAIRFQLALDRGGDLTYACKTFFEWLLQLEKVTRSYLRIDSVHEESAMQLEKDVLANLSLRTALYAIIVDNYKDQCAYEHIDHNELPTPALNLVFARLVASFVRLRLREFRRYVAGRLKLSKQEESLRRKLKVLMADKGVGKGGKAADVPKFIITAQILQHLRAAGFHNALFAQLSVYGRSVLAVSFSLQQLLVLCRAYGQPSMAYNGFDDLVTKVYGLVMQCTRPVSIDLSALFDLLSAGHASTVLPAQQGQAQHVLQPQQGLRQGGQGGQQPERRPPGQQQQLLQPQPHEARQQQQQPQGPQQQPQGPQQQPQPHEAQQQQQPQGAQQHARTSRSGRVLGNGPVRFR